MQILSLLYTASHMDIVLRNRAYYVKESIFSLIDWKNDMLAIFHFSESHAFTRKYEIINVNSFVLTVRNNRVICSVNEKCRFLHCVSAKIFHNLSVILCLN